MNILGIETSCDETAAAVVQNGHFVLSNVIASSLKEHSLYGGVIPEIASRRQLEFITTVVDKALIESGASLKSIHAIAVTQKPGLIGSLLVGISFARSLSYALNKPLIDVDHIKAHAYANFLEPSRKKQSKNKASVKKPRLPAIALVVSGGHTNLYYIKDFTRFRLLGQTLDDAAGEAFDKVAKILGLGYPGGPVIDRLAKQYQINHNSKIQFKSAALPGTYNFSFSGVKTAVLYHYQRRHKQDKFSPDQTVHAFQESVVSILTKKSINACLKYKAKTLLVGGGVAANSGLRETLTTEAAVHKINVHFPPMSLCTDNAAMIAGLGFHFIRKRRPS